MRSLFWRFLRSYVLVLLVSVLVVGAALSYFYTQSVFEARTGELLENGRRIAQWIERTTLQGRPPVALRYRVEGIASTLKAWVAVVDAEGLVQLTSEENPRFQRLRLGASDVRQVIQEGKVVTRRGFEEAVGEVAVTALVPVHGPGGVLGAVVLYSPIRGITDTFRRSLRLLLIASVMAVLIGTAASYALSRRLVMPLEEMTQVARQMASGNFTRRVRSDTRDELSILGFTLNELASRLGKTIGELTQEKRKTESIVDGISEGVIATDADGRIILANPTGSRLAQSSPHIMGIKMEDDPSLGGLWSAFVEAMQEKRRVRRPEVRLDERVFALSVAPLWDEEGNVGGAVGILHDVSERYELERAQRDFVANVSHELRTPLTSIRGFAQAILDGMVSGEAQVRRYLRVIMDESLRLIRLSNTLLDLSKIQAKAISLSLEPVDVREVVEDVTEILNPTLVEHEVEVRQDLPDFPLIVADHDRLAQIMLNLLDNAVRHTQPGRAVTVSGEMVSDEEGSRVVIYVEDQGSGIPREDLPRIWDRFYKIDKSRRSERGVGTGLGLVIVKELVELHGGRVGAENRPEGGAVFWIELPVELPRT